jgi:hypothetical protein
MHEEIGQPGTKEKGAVLLAFLLEDFDFRFISQFCIAANSLTENPCDH